MKGQLSLFGAVPVGSGNGSRNRGKAGSRSAKQRETTDVSENPDSNDFAGSRDPKLGNRSSSTITTTYPRFPSSPPKGGKETGTAPTSQAPLAGERVFASLSPPAARESRDREPVTAGESGRSADREPDRSYKLNAPIGVGRAPTLRPYQVEALTAIDAAFELVLRTLLVLATGLGKTVVFAEWCRRRVAAGRRVLVIAHRTELLEQAQKKLHDVGVWAAIEQAEKRAGLASVVVASVQTLRGKRLKQFDPSAFDIVIDEAHHTNAASYRAIVEYFAGALVLGVTATPDRGDGQALGDVFESLAYRFEIREGIDAGYLVPVRARQIHVEGVDLSTVRSRAGDLAQDELAAIMSAEQAVIGVVDPLLREAGDRKTIVFCVDVTHAKAITEAINRFRAGAARVGHGELSSSDRAELLAAFDRGEFQFLVNCMLYTEGFDCPAIACVATVRPTKSRAMVVQQVGRGTRLLGLTLEESIANGKPEVLWLDFTGNSGRHKLVGPIDALAAGDVDDDVRAEADRMLAEEAGDVDEILDEAARRLEERRRAAKITASATYFARDINPFLGEQLGEPCIEPWANEPATPDQIHRLINDVGLKRLPPTLNRGEATRILGAHEERRKLGLCSYKQAKLLERYGIDAAKMSKNSASARIGVLSQNDWDPGRARRQLAAIEASEMIAASKAAAR